MSRPRLAIVGGGVTGLAAAYAAAKTDRDLAITVYESNESTGGRLRTSDVGGRMVDEGADAFLIRSPEALDLVRDLGLGDHLVHPARGNAELWLDGRREQLPAGLVLGVPTDAGSIAACDWLGPEVAQIVEAESERRGDPLREEQTVGQYIRDHFGDRVCDLLVEPLIGGINAGLVDQLSLDASSPMLATAARADASMVRALRARPQQAAEGPIFGGLRGGIATLVGELRAALDALGVAVLSDASITNAQVADGGAPIGLTSGDRDFEADGLICAAPAHEAAELLATVDAQAATALARIPFASVAVVTLVMNGAIDAPTEAAGLLVPRTAPGFHTTAISFASSKWPHISPDGATVLRVSLGHAGDDAPLDWGDEDLVARTLSECATLLGVDLTPDAARVTRWGEAFAQYEVGHQAAVADAAEAFRNVAPIELAGSSYFGIGIPASIGSANAAVGRVLGRLHGA